MKEGSITSIILLVLAIVSDLYFSGSREIKPKYMFLIFNYAPAVIKITSEIKGFLLYPTWPFKHPNIFILCLIGIACIPSLIGFFEGLFLGLKNNRWSIKPWWKVVEIAKYGTPPDKSDGRFEITSKHIVYTLSSNILGASCAIGLFLFVQTMPDFLNFIVYESYGWTQYFEITLGFAMFVALIFNSVQQNRPDNKEPQDKKYKQYENPKNFLLNRVHAILNTVYLTVLLYLIFINIFYIVAYPIIIIYWKSGNRLELHPLIFFPIIGAFLFLLFGSASDSAKNFIPQAFGNFVTGVIVLVVFVIVWSFSLFNISLIHLFIVILSIAMISIYLIVYLKFKKASKQNNFLPSNYRDILSLVPTIIFLAEALIVIVWGFFLWMRQ